MEDTTEVTQEQSKDETQEETKDKTHQEKTRDETPVESKDDTQQESKDDTQQESNDETHQKESKEETQQETKDDTQEGTKDDSKAATKDEETETEDEREKTEKETQEKTKDRKKDEPKELTLEDLEGIQVGQVPFVFSEPPVDIDDLVYSTEGYTGKRKQERDRELEAFTKMYADEEEDNKYDTYMDKEEGTYSYTDYWLYPPSFNAIGHDRCLDCNLRSLAQDRHIHPEVMDWFATYLREHPGSGGDVRVFSSTMWEWIPNQAFEIDCFTKISDLRATIDKVNRLYSYEPLEELYRQATSKHEFVHPNEISSLLFPIYYREEGSDVYQWAVIVADSRSGQMETLDPCGNCDFSILMCVIANFLVELDRQVHVVKKTGEEVSGGDGWTFLSGRLFETETELIQEKDTTSSGMWTMFLVLLCNFKIPCVLPRLYKDLETEDFRKTLWFHFMQDKPRLKHPLPQVLVHDGDGQQHSLAYPDHMWMEEIGNMDKEFPLEFLHSYCFFLDRILRFVQCQVRVIGPRTLADGQEHDVRGDDDIAQLIGVHISERKGDLPKVTVVSVYRDDDDCVAGWLSLPDVFDLQEGKQKEDFMEAVATCGRLAVLAGWLDESTNVEDPTQYCKSKYVPKNASAKGKGNKMDVRILHGVALDADSREGGSAACAIVDMTLLLFFLLGKPRTNNFIAWMDIDPDLNRTGAGHLLLRLMKCCHPSLEFSHVADYNYFCRIHNDPVRSNRVVSPGRVAGDVGARFLDLYTTLENHFNFRKFASVEAVLEHAEHNFQDDFVLSQLCKSVATHRNKKLGPPKKSVPNTPKEDVFTEFTKKFFTLYEDFTKRLMILEKTSSVDAGDKFPGLGLNHDDKAFLTESLQYSGDIGAMPNLSLTVSVRKVKQLLNRYKPVRTAATRKSNNEFDRYWETFANDTKSRPEEAAMSRGIRNHVASLNRVFGKCNTYAEFKADSIMVERLEEAIEFLTYGGVEYWSNLRLELKNKEDMKQMLDLVKVRKPAEDDSNGKKRYAKQQQRRFELLKQYHDLSHCFPGRFTFTHGASNDSGGDARKDESTKNLRKFLKAFLEQLQTEQASREDRDRTAAMSVEARLRRDKTFNGFFNSSNKVVKGQSKSKQMADFFAKQLQTPASDDDSDFERIMKGADDQERDYVDSVQKKILQITHLRYSNASKTWLCRTTEQQGAGSKRKHHDEPVEEQWVRTNFVPEFVGFVMATNKRDQDYFVPTPVGRREGPFVPEISLASADAATTHLKGSRPRHRKKKKARKGVPVGWGQTRHKMARAENIKLEYWSDAKNYCLGYGLASALAYVGYRDEAAGVASMSEQWSCLPGPTAIQELKRYMENHMPCIGRCTIMWDRLSASSKRRNTAKKKVHKTDFSIHDLCKCQDKFIKLVIPVNEDMGIGHCFYTVDDLIFDASCSHALKLCYSSVNGAANGIKGLAYVAKFWKPTKEFSVYRPDPKRRETTEK